MDKITKTVYINLAHRTDRNNNIINQFKKLEFPNYERFEAIKTDFGGLGCCQSHIAILEQFLQENKQFLYTPHIIDFKFNEETNKSINNIKNDFNFDYVKGDDTKSVKHTYRGMYNNSHRIKSVKKLIDEPIDEKIDEKIYEPIDKAINKILMIVEDDAEFMVSRNELDKYINAFIDSQAYGMCLGYFIHDVKPFNELFMRSNHVATTSCYLVKMSIIPELIKCFKESEYGLLQIEKNKLNINSKEFREEYNKYAIDQLWKKLHTEYLFIIPKIKCVEQYANYSDIEKRNIVSRH
jgi:hypothetical protein